jgi:hypothetical protein
MSVNRKLTVPVGSSGAREGCGAGPDAACRRRRSSSPVPSTIATTPQRIPVGEASASPDPTHPAAATETAITPLSRVVAMTPGLSARSAAGRSRPAGGWLGAGSLIPLSIAQRWARGSRPPDAVAGSRPPVMPAVPAPA